MRGPELLLLAIDSSATQHLMERVLRATGFDISIANDQPGLEKWLQESSPALLILGEEFCGADGIQLSQKILERFPTLPILLYAEQESTDLIKAVLKAGLSGYLCPPLRTDEIIDAIKRSLSRARQLGDWIRREVRNTTSSLVEKVEISEAERTKLDAIFTNIQDGVVVLDDRGDILFANPSIHATFGLPKRSLIGKHFATAIPNLDLVALLSRSSDGPLKYHEINLDDGRVFNAQYTQISNLGVVIAIQDISYLKELDRMKNEFVYTVSHDLRSPLTALLGYIELIDRVGPLNDMQRQFVDRIRDSIQHITMLVNDLLDLGAIETGFDSRRESVQLNDVFHNSLDMFEPQLQKKKIALSQNVAAELPPLRANPVRIRQLVDNLLGNAIKYTPEGGSIRVSLLPQDGQLIFAVTDTGPGIPPAEQSRIFDKFYRASNVPKVGSDSGLGLAIVKSIVASHQGRVWVESTLGKGSSFFVVLPAHEPAE